MRVNAQAAVSCAVGGMPSIHYRISCYLVACRKPDLCILTTHNTNWFILTTPIVGSDVQDDMLHDNHGHFGQPPQQSKLGITKAFVRWLRFGFSSTTAKAGAVLDAAGLEMDLLDTIVKP